MIRQAYTGSLRAMSTTVTIIGIGITEAAHNAAMNEVEHEVQGWEQRFSRFRADSLLSHVNAAAGAWSRVDREFTELLAAAREAVFATEGRFNPAILDALESHGYDRTITDVRTTLRPEKNPVATVAGLEDWGDVQIDIATSQVRLPVGMRMDFGGIAKGALADRFAQRFASWPGGAISIGGDMCVWGESPDEETWRVGIEHPLDPGRDIAVAEVPAGQSRAIATSSRTKRSWRSGHGTAHHLIDPYTGAPTDGQMLAVSVCAPTAMSAEIVTKNLMVAAAHGLVQPVLLLDAHWALLIPDTLDLVRIS